MNDDEAKRVADGITRSVGIRWGLFGVATEDSSGDFVRVLVTSAPFTPRGLPDAEADAPHIVEPNP